MGNGQGRGRVKVDLLTMVGDFFIIQKTKKQEGKREKLPGDLDKRSSRQVRWVSTLLGLASMRVFPKQSRSPRACKVSTRQSKAKNTDRWIWQPVAKQDREAWESRE